MICTNTNPQCYIQENMNFVYFSNIVYVFLLLIDSIAEYILPFLVAVASCRYLFCFCMVLEMALF